MIQTAWLRVGDVARVLGEPEHVVRLWHYKLQGFMRRTVPRSTGGQRCFSPDAVAVLTEYRRLVREELYTHAGAKRQLRLAAERSKEAG